MSQYIIKETAMIYC